jgi:prepilin-type processing-associated H-X9-DG protein
MPIEFSCPYCGKQTLVADQYAGQSGPCSACGQTVTIPGAPSKTLDMSHPAPLPRPASSGSGAGVVLAIVAICIFAFLGCGGVLVALLLPAVQSAREAARRSQCSNHLKQIALAFHNYHDTYGTFPPAYIADEDGQPKHSWRVLLLPFMEQQALYSMYDFDEPWDSPVNAMVTNTVLPVFQCPSDPASGMPITSYMVITGPGTVFDGDQATGIRDITDGTSNTLLVVEVAGTGTSWAEPVDLDVGNLNLPFARGGNSPGSYHPGGINAAMCDGSVRFLPNGINPATFNALITRSGGEMVQSY